MTPLMFAAQRGHVKVAAKLILAKSDVDKQDNRGWTVSMEQVSNMLSIARGLYYLNKNHRLVHPTICTQMMTLPTRNRSCNNSDLAMYISKYLRNFCQDSTVCS